MMSAEKEVKPSLRGDVNEMAKKVWLRPRLRKLPIKATSAGSTTGNEGINGKKSGYAGNIS